MDKEVLKEEANKSILKRNLKNQTLILSNDKSPSHSSTWKLLQGNFQNRLSLTNASNIAKSVKISAKSRYNDLSKSLMKLLYGGNVNLPNETYTSSAPKLLGISDTSKGVETAKPIMKSQSINLKETVVKHVECTQNALDKLDAQRRMSKMSWGENRASSHTVNSTSSGDGTTSAMPKPKNISSSSIRSSSGSSHFPSPPKARGGGVGKAIFQLIWFSTKLVFLTSLCVWTAEEGLWGSYCETQEFNAKLESLLNQLPSILEQSKKENQK